ncbi:MAG: hypothetical protein Q9171_004894 [Xanthocarpia ochracea]
MLPSKCASTQSPPQKLSKPPTNTSSSNLLAPTRQAPEPVSPFIASDDSADGYFTGMPAHGERKERHNTRSRIRSYLYGPSPESGHSRSSEDEENSPRKLAVVARDVRRRLSRTDSAISQSLTAGGVSAASSSSRLHVDISPSDLDEHDVVKEQIKEKVWVDTLAAQNHVSTPIDEDKHPDSVKSPIRRRSLYTPGIATRSPEDILRKPPPPEHVRSQADRDYYYNPALPDSSPLARLANLRTSQNGRSTPSELDYGHLGALMLGTLRVTNGTASPAPREQDISPAPISALDTPSYECCYELSDGGRSEPDGYLTMGDVMKDTLPSSRDNSHRAATIPAEATSNTVAPPNYISSDRESHSQRGSGAGSFASARSLTLNCKPIKRKPLPETSSRGRLDHANRGTLRSDHCLSETGAHLDRAIQKPQTVQKDNIEHRKPGLLSTQEQQPDDCRSLIADADQVYPHNWSREDAFLKLTKNQSARDDPGCAYDTNENLRHESSLDKQHFDSGYSSNVSLDSTQMSTSKQSPVPFDVPAQMQSSLTPLLQTPQGSKPNRYSQGSNGSRKDPELDPRPHSISDKQTRPFATADIERFSMSIDPERLTFQKQPSSPDKPRKLQKKRPKSQPPLHRTPTSVDSILCNADIPPVPTEIAAPHSDRVERFSFPDRTSSTSQDNDEHDMPEIPTSISIQTRFPSPMHGSEESLPRDRRSVFQKMASKAKSRSRSRPRIAESPCRSDDESAKSDICRSPSWSEYNKDKTEQRKKAKAERELQKQLKRESSHDPDARSRSKSRSRSRFRSRSKKRSSLGEPTPTLTDFGTVSESLGAGPRDIAIATHTPNHQSLHNQIQPCQMKPLNCASGVDSKPNVSVCPTERRRLRSYTSATVTLNAGVYASKCALPRLDRPHTMYFDSRPIPAMPMADLAQRRPMLPRTNDYNMSGDAQMMNTAQHTSSNRLTPAPEVAYEAARQPPIEPKNQAQLTSTSGLMTDKTDTMEELVDKLLEAPSLEAREIVLEQIRHVRHRSMVESKNAIQQSSRNVKSVSQEDAEAALAPTTSPMIATRPRAGTVEAREPKTIKLTANDHVRYDGMFIDAPPMPPLPTAADLKQQKSRRFIEQSTRSKTLIAPHTPALEPTKTDLWQGCAIQAEHRKAIESGTDWDAHRLAWSRRRKSAGEALLVQNRPSGMMSPMSPGDVSNVAKLPPTVSRATTAGSEQPVVPKDSPKAFHRPWAPSQGHEAFEGHRTGSPQTGSTVASTAHTFERRSGRYEGGLLFGYEKGFGLAGSAGTRSMKTGATRKSLQMSQGFGVDLSDVPIFVASSK